MAKEDIKKDSKLTDATPEKSGASPFAAKEELPPPPSDEITSEPEFLKSQLNPAIAGSGEGAAWPEQKPIEEPFYWNKIKRNEPGAGDLYECLADCFKKRLFKAGKQYRLTECPDPKKFRKL